MELKSRFSDNGPAWIGVCSTSKSGATIYFNGHAFKSLGGQGSSGNYYDVETGEEYWISGVKKNNQDRHRAGSGKILIDASAIEQYLLLTGKEKLPSNLSIVELLPPEPSAENHQRENQTLRTSE